MILRARVVLPILAPPVEDGAVVISENRITGVGRWSDLKSNEANKSLVDLGKCILLPGLVNAHCHLDYTDLAGGIPPQKSFVDWITLMLARKSEWSYTEFAQSWLRGARMLLRSGTTTVVDIEAVPELLPEVWSATPMRVISLLELTGVRSRRAPREILHEAADVVHSLPGGCCRAGLSPHAPYSTLPELVRAAAALARGEAWPFSMHLAESLTEYEMFTHARGKMFDWLKRQGRDMSDCGLGSPIRQMDRVGALEPGMLAAHVNYLSPNDAALLARRGATVVHCPRSHQYFGHRRFPIQPLLRAGVNLCLGTDSLATVWKRRNEVIELSMFDEMRAFARANPRVPSKFILRMATLNGARALGMAGQIGQLSEGALADLIAIPFRGRTAQVHHAVTNHHGPVSASIINGQWVIGP